MDVSVTIADKTYSVNLANPIDIAIAVTGAQPQLTVNGVPATRLEPLRAGSKTLSVLKGGDLNCDSVFFVPHCNGTHTECVGHISEQRYTIREMMLDTLIPATVLTVVPQPASNCGERCHPAPKVGDRVITRKTLATQLEMRDTNFFDALILRTTPNAANKKTMNYDREIPPYFTVEAMDFITEMGVRHLVVDMPSVDRVVDEGHLAAHHIFWGVPGGSHNVPEPSSKTITELVYVPDEVKDGLYVLNLQVAAFESDAAPSRPVLFEIRPLKVV